jgi:hypothetical protein
MTFLVPNVRLATRDLQGKRNDLARDFGEERERGRQGARSRRGRGRRSYNGSSDETENTSVGISSCFTELGCRAGLVSWGRHWNETGAFSLLFKRVPNQQICWCVQLINVHEISHETALRLALRCTTDDLPHFVFPTGTSFRRFNSSLSVMEAKNHS